MTRSLARSHPDACGGRIARPRDIPGAAKLYRTRGIVAASIHDESLTARDRADLSRIAVAVGLTGERRGKAATEAAQERERVFGGDGADGVQRASVANGGGNER